MDSDDDIHHHCLDDMACLLMCQVVVIVIGMQQWLGAVEQWLLEMVVVGGSDTAEEDGEDLVHQMRGKELGGECVMFEHKSKIFQFRCSTCHTRGHWD